MSIQVRLVATSDIKPGSDTNPINPMGRGVIPVALLGSDTFDVADVDVTTLPSVRIEPLPQMRTVVTWRM